MLIRCWGARGSIPVSGKDYEKYGGDTTCLEIRTRSGDVIIIDAGSGLRPLGNRLLHEQIDEFHFFLTHSHLDHILGFPFFKPLYRSHSNITIYGCPFAQKSIQNMFSGTLSPPFFPINFNDIHANIRYKGACKKSTVIGSVTIHPIMINHPNKGIGFRVEEDQSSFVFLTDNELGFSHPGGKTFDEYVAFSRSTDLLIHDSEFTEEEYITTRSWGHSRYLDSLKLAIMADVRRFCLFHHNQDRNDAGIDRIVQHCRKITQEQQLEMEIFAMWTGYEIRL